MGPPPPPRISNALGDLALGVGHVYALTLLRGTTRRDGLFWLVLLYFVTLLCFQWLGAYFHLSSPGGPDDADLDLGWLAYLGFGCTTPCFYGAALSLDLLGSRRVAATWIACGLAYFCLAVARLDLADVLPLPRAVEVMVPPVLVRAMASMTWMPSALRANNGLLRAPRVGGVIAMAARTPPPANAPSPRRLFSFFPKAAQAPTNGTLDEASGLVLRFDGRGYARIPFEATFDDAFADEKDLVAAFPCWRSDSLTLLMLVFGVVANLFHLVICLSRRKTHPRAKRYLIAHAAMKIALLTMPLAMLLGGVQGGIDWMHACAAPAMFIQAKNCLESLKYDENPPTHNKGDQQTATTDCSSSWISSNHTTTETNKQKRL